MSVPLSLNIEIELKMSTLRGNAGPVTGWQCHIGLVVTCNIHFAYCEFLTKHPQLLTENQHSLLS